MSNQPETLENLSLTHRPLVVPRWWVFAFVVSFVVFSSTLLFFGGEAFAKGGGGPAGGVTSGGGDSGGKGGNPGKGGDSGNKGGGAADPAGGIISGGGGGRADSAKGVDGPRGGDGPNNPTSDNGSPLNKDVSGDTTGPVRDVAKNDARPSLGGAPSLGEKHTEPVLGLGSVGRVADTAGPAIEEATKAIKPVAQSAQPLIEQAGPLVEPIKEATDPVIRPIQDTVAPIGEAARPVLAPASEALEPVVAPIQDTVAPVAEPVSEFAGSPVLGDPLDGALNGASSSPILEPLAVSVEEGAPLLVGDGVGDGGQPFWLQTAESSLHQATLPAAPATVAVAANTPLDGSGTVSAPAAQEEGNLQSSASGATANLSGSQLERQLGLSLLEGLASLNLTGIEGAQSQMPQPFPAGAMPAGGFSGGSSSSSSGGGLETGILSLLAILLLGGKFLWSARDSLKSDTALLLAIERPG